ncbi:amino acid aminotransferase [Mycobacterium sp. 1100029.7]|nr:amino acid aminotransferase [Mycobacterium sp. 1100029.7]
MTTATSTPPADPESAALDLLVRSAETATGSTAFRAVLQDLAGALHVEGAFAGLVWVDARLVAAAVSFDVCTATDPVESLHRRAAAVRAGRGPRCVNPAGIAQALDVAATVLDMAGAGLRRGRWRRHGPA